MLELWDKSLEAVEWEQPIAEPISRKVIPALRMDLALSAKAGD